MHRQEVSPLGRTGGWGGRAGRTQTSAVPAFPANFRQVLGKNQKQREADQEDTPQAPPRQPSLRKRRSARGFAMVCGWKLNLALCPFNLRPRKPFLGASQCEREKQTQNKEGRQ